MRSIRSSLIVGTVLVMLCVLSIASVAIYRGARNTMVAHLDEELGEDIRLVASTVRTNGDRVELEFRDLDMPEFVSETGPGYLQLWADDGSVLYRSPGLKSTDLETVATVAGDGATFEWLRIPGGKRVRAAALQFQPEPDDEPDDDVEGISLPARRSGPIVLRIVAAVEPAEIDAFLARLKVLLVAVGGLTALFAGAMLALVVRSRLRPLDELADKIEALGDDDLSARVQLRSTPREMEPIVGQLNQLLSRLQGAFERERTFSADIAHELRTPMAGLRSSVEVTLSRPREADDYRETLEQTLDPIRRVQTMVETLLYLGRLEAGQIAINERSVDIRELASVSWQPLMAAARERRLVVTWEQPRAFSVVTDPALLEIAIRNILENATLYANEGGYLRVGITEENGSITLRVVNSGSQVASEDVAALLGRFARGDLSRGAAGDHFGLGLALTSKIAAALGCSMLVQSHLGGEFSVTLQLDGEQARAAG